MKYIVFAIIFTVAGITAEQPYYLSRCARDDPEINTCIKNTANRLAKFLRQGVPELEIYEVEPVLIDEIGISLGSGPDGYRASFRNIEAYGVSNLTVSNVKSDIETHQYQLTFEIPKISVKAQYRSSGVLILVRASGAGDYWGEYQGVRAKAYFKAIPELDEVSGLTFLTVDKVKIDFSVKDITMGVDNVANGNTVIQAALNLFINSNAQELLKEMKPALRDKLTLVLRNFVDRLFEKIPVEQLLE
ncbi:hypothetical protein HA402_010782 [Bradysia odoriphaga]|nr:hypothetical protein HA402_010782 [Bradysia odoriphaga]